MLPFWSPGATGRCSHLSLPTTASVLCIHRQQRAPAERQAHPKRVTEGTQQPRSQATYPASVITVQVKYSHRGLPSNADQLQIVNTSCGGRNGHRSPAVTRVTLRRKPRAVSLVSTFPVGIRNDQEMPEAPADLCLKVTLCYL